MNSTPSNISRFLLMTLSGILYAAAFPPLGWRFLIIPAIALMLFALHKSSVRIAFYAGLWQGFVVYGIGLSWFFNIFQFSAVILYLILALFTGLFAAFQSKANVCGWRGSTLALFTALNWSGWEFIRAELFPLKFPWMTAGLALGPQALLSVIGVYGVSFLLLLAVSFLLTKGLRLWGTFVIVALGISIVLFRPAAPIQEENVVRVAAIQFEGTDFISYLAATKNLPDSVNLVVWPEHALSYDLRQNSGQWQALISQARTKNQTFVIGHHSQETLHSEVWQNSALTLDASGEKGMHHKNHPVHFFDDGKAGSEALPISTSLGLIGTPVCFDCDYEGVVRRMTAGGAEFFAVPMMDAMHWSQRQQLQHAELFRIRAAENGRWMLIGGSSGVSQIIDPHGVVHVSLPAHAQDTLTGKLGKVQTLTFYTRFGWLSPWLILVMATLVWIRCLVFPRPFKA